MKLVLASFLSFVATALGQSITIGEPAGRALNMNRGQPVNVMVERFRTLSPSTEIGIAITIHHCTQNPCEDVSQTLGTILYNGLFNPQETGGLQPYQNFSVTIPDTFAQGPAVLSVAHAMLIGAGPALGDEIKNVTVAVL